MNLDRHSNRFVIFRPGALGDTLVAAPVIWALKQRYREARIEYISELHKASSTITSQQAVELIPEIWKTHLYNLESNWKTRLLDLRGKLTPKSSDVLLYLCYERSSWKEVFRDLLFFFLLGFRRFIGFRTALQGVADMKRGVVSNESEYTRILRFANSSWLNLSKAPSGILCVDSAWGERFVKENGFHDSKIIVVCPGSKMQSKRWPPEYYARTITELSKDANNLAFVIIGGTEDHPIADEIIRNTNVNVVSAIGTSLLQTSAILSHAKVYLGNDTGPMHMAALLGVSCVAIFSSRDREGKWYPYGDGHIIFRINMPCSGCMLQECFSMPAVCLLKINVDMVVDAVRQTLKGQRIAVSRNSE